MADPLSTPSEHSEQSRHYRELAIAIRERLPTLRNDELYAELSLLAAHYERLAKFVDSSGSPGSGNGSASST
jgi:hypothetical protein